jgi:hypothetical protein
VLAKLKDWFASRKVPITVVNPALPTIQPPSRPQWTEANQQQLAAFLLSSTGIKLITMLQGAQYSNALAGAKSGNDRITLGIGESLKLIANLALHSDPVPDTKPEHKLSEEEKLFNSWKP